MGGDTHHTGMWVKLQLGWQQDTAQQGAAEQATQALLTSMPAVTQV